MSLGRPCGGAGRAVPPPAAWPRRGWTWCRPGHCADWPWVVTVVTALTVVISKIIATVVTKETVVTVIAEVAVVAVVPACSCSSDSIYRKRGPHQKVEEYTP